MAKKVSIFLVALMVLTLFTAVAIAAVNGAICPECDQGEVRYWVTTDTVVSNPSCSHGLLGTDQVEIEYMYEHERCSFCGVGTTTRSIRSRTVTCMGVPQQYN